MIMKLKKTRERAVRMYDVQNSPTETVESAEFVVTDDDGVTIGNVSCSMYSANLSLNVPSGSIDEGAQKIAEILGATIEEGGEV